jgi:hypothetical protein
MPQPTKTNPAYAHLAYQGAIRDAVIELVMERYVGNEAAPPEQEIECAQLVREDAIVPLDEILHFVNELKDGKLVIDRELGRFEFTRRDDEQGLHSRDGYAGILQPAKSVSEPKAAASAEQAEKKRHSRRRRGRRGSRRSTQKPQ